jgi:hypothetical protein
MLSNFLIQTVKPQALDSPGKRARSFHGSERMNGELARRRAMP